MASGTSTGEKVLTGCSCISIFIFLRPALTARSRQAPLSERLPDTHGAQARSSDASRRFIVGTPRPQTSHRAIWSAA